MRNPTSDSRDVDVTGSYLLMQTTFRGTFQPTGSARTSPSVPDGVDGRTRSNYPSSNYSPMIGLRWEYSPMVGVKIAAVLGGFFLLFAVYNTVKGMVRCSRRGTEEDDEEETSDDAWKQSEELEVVEEQRLDCGWEQGFSKRGVDDLATPSLRPEMRTPPHHPLSLYLGRLQCSVEIPDCDDRNCEGTDARPNRV